MLPAAAVDGKALRGARTEHGRVFLVGAISHETGVVLGQRQVTDKRGEGPAAHDLPASLDVSGIVLTLDALHTTQPGLGPAGDSSISGRAWAYHAGNVTIQSASQ